MFGCVEKKGTATRNAQRVVKRQRRVRGKEKKERKKKNKKIENRRQTRKVEISVLHTQCSSPLSSLHGVDSSVWYVVRSRERERERELCGSGVGEKRERERERERERKGERALSKMISLFCKATASPTACHTLTGK